MAVFTNDYSVNIIDNNSIINEISSDIRLYYVLDGRAILKIEERQISIDSKEVVIANSLERVKLLKCDDLVMAEINIDYYKLCKLTNRNRIKLDNSMKLVAGADYTKIISLIQNLLLESLSFSDGKVIRGYICYFQLVDILLDRYYVSTSVKKGEDVEKILQHIHANYLEDISLGEIADELYISLSTASRMLSAKTGVNFATYLKRLRLQYAEKLLSQTNMSITRVAIESGFSSHSLLNRAFKEEFRCTPTEYREREQICDGKVISGSSISGNEKAKLLLEEAIKFENQSIDDVQIIEADTDESKFIDFNRDRVLNVGPADVMSSALMQKHILFLVDGLGIEYIRIWNIFSPKMMVEKIDEKYNFSFIDEIMDFCVEKNIKLFIDLAQRKEVALASEKKAIFQNPIVKEYSKEEWTLLLTAFFHHIRKRYGLRIIEKWIFEFTFFLNDRPYYITDRYSSTEVWNTGYEIVKSIVPRAKVAGPGLIASDNKEYLDLILEGFSKAKYWPDIFTSINFPYYRIVAGISSSAYDGEIKKNARRDYISWQVLILWEILKKHNYSGAYWITDWGNSLGSRNYIQDSCFRAAQILENEIRNVDNVDGMGIFFASDLINTYSDTNEILYGGAGIITRNGICKPAFYAYQFLNRLGKNIIKIDDNCIISMEEDNEIKIICFSNKTLSPKYYLSEENAHRPEDIRNLFSNLEDQNMKINIKRVKNGTYTIRHRYVNEEYGSILDEWISLNCPDVIALDDMDYLKQSTIPKLELHKCRVEKNELNIEITLRANEIRYMEITLD